MMPDGVIWMRHLKQVQSSCCYPELVAEEEEWIHEGKPPSCVSPAHFDCCLVGDELGQAPSQVTQVADLDVQDLDDAPHLHFRVRLLLLAGGQRLLGALDLTLQLRVSALHILWTNAGVCFSLKPCNTDLEPTSRFEPFWQEKPPHRENIPSGSFRLNCCAAYLNVELCAFHNCVNPTNGRGDEHKESKGQR